MGCFTNYWLSIHIWLLRFFLGMNLVIIGKGNRLKQCLREVSLLKTGDVFVVISLFPSTWANFIATVKTANVTTSSAVNSRVSPPSTLFQVFGILMGIWSLPPPQIYQPLNSPFWEVLLCGGSVAIGFPRNEYFSTCNKILSSCLEFL